MGLFLDGYYIFGATIWCIFSAIFVLWIISFFTLLFGDPGRMENELKNFKGTHACSVVCDKCQCVKPYRAHHCSRCGHCHARMDHHCDALGICIALRNLKIFLLFLFYSIIMLTIYAATCCFRMFAVFHSGIPYMLLFDVFAGGTLAMLLCILLFDHLRNLFIGRTPLEQTFNVVIETEKTHYERFQEAFGPPSINWILPVPPSYDTVSPFMWEQYRKEEKKDK